MYLNMPVHSAAWKIFHTGWTISVERLHLISEVEANTIGICHGEDMSITEFMKERAQTRWPISEIAELVDSGATPWLVNLEDSIEIYKIIEEHLLQSVDSYNNRISDVRPPIADLRKLDELNRLIYPWATRFMDGDHVKTTFETFLSNAGKSKAGIVSNRNIVLSKSEKTSSDTSPKYRYESPLKNLAVSGASALLGERLWQ